MSGRFSITNLGLFNHEHLQFKVCFWCFLYLVLVAGCGSSPVIPLVPPEADAGFNRNVIIGQKVTLNAMVNEGEGYSYTWNQLSSPLVTLNNNNQNCTWYTPTCVGECELQLVVNISDQNDYDSVTITTLAGENAQPPIAKAGSDRIASPNIQVELDARASYDPDGGALTYRWRQIAGPKVTLTNSNTARPTFTSPDTISNISFEFELLVIDAELLSDTDSVKITISSSSPNQYNFGSFVQNGGTIVPAEGAYNENSNLTITAANYNGWQFDHWLGDVNGDTNPVTIIMDANTFVIAVFEKVDFDLSVTVEGEGEVTPNSGSYEAFSSVTLTATPNNPDWKFDRWLGDLTESTNPATIVMDKDKNITAVFVETTQVSAPSFDPPSHTLFNESMQVTISSETEDAAIYYTLDGTDPTESSSLYTAPLLITQSVTINARAYKAGLTPSAVTSGNYQTMMVPAGIIVSK